MVVVVVGIMCAPSWGVCTPRHTLAAMIARSSHNGKQCVLCCCPHLQHVQALASRVLLHAIPGPHPHSAICCT